MSQLSLQIPIPKRALRRPVEPIVRTAEVESCDPYVYRWIMHRAWGTGPTVLWALLNPSDADGSRDDPTTQRMMGFSYRWGFGSMIVVNIYPLVSSTTPALRLWRETFDWKTYEDNGMRPFPYDNSTWSAFHHNIGKVNNALTADMTCIAAWGNGAASDDVDQFLTGVRLSVNDEEFGDIGVGVDWHCIGKTQNGSPVHPLARGRYRVPDERKLTIWKRAGRNSPERSSCT